MVYLYMCKCLFLVLKYLTQKNLIVKTINLLTSCIPKKL